MFEKIKHIEIIILHSMILLITVTDSIMDLFVYHSFISFALNVILAITILVSVALEFRNLRRQCLLFTILMARFIVSIIYYGPQAIWFLLLVFRGFKSNWIFLSSINIIQMIFLNLQYQSQVQIKFYHISINYGILILGEALVSFFNQSPLVICIQKLIQQKFDETICYAFSKDLKELALNFLNTTKKQSKTFPTFQTENTYILTPKANSNIFFISQYQNYELAQITIYYQQNDCIQPVMEGGNCQQKSKLIVRSLQELIELRKQDENFSQQLIVATMIDLENNQKKRYTVTISEINSILLMQLTQLNSNCSLRENQKIIKFKQRLVNIFQHKLKTPLNSAIGHLLTAKDDKEIPEIVKQQYLQPALLNCTLQIYQVQDILDYLSSEVDQLATMAQKIDLLKLVQEVFDLIEFQCKMKSINVTFRMNNVDLKNHNEQINIYTDPNKLTRVLVNLLNNSYRYTAENGWIQLDMKTNHLQKSTLFIIRDSGEGMPKEDIQSLNLQLIDFSNKNFAIIKKSRYKEIDSKIGISLLITNKLIKLLSGDSSVLKAKRDNDGGMEFSFSINDTFEILSECSLELKKKNSFAKQQSLRQLTKSQNQSTKKISQFSILQKQSEPTTQNVLNIKKQIECEEIDDEPLPQVILTKTKPQINRLNKSKQTIHQSYLKQKRLFNISSLKSIPKIKQQQFQNIQQEISQLPEYQESQYILIVDDEPFNIDTVTMMMRKLGYQKYLKAFNGEQCLEIVKSYNTQIFAIFMDIDMPIMNGIQATQILVDQMNESKIEYIPIIGCTAHEDIETHIKCFDVGMIHIVVKPIFLKSILEAFQKIKEFFQETNINNIEDIQRSKSYNSK